MTHILIFTESFRILSRDMHVGPSGVYSAMTVLAKSKVGFTFPSSSTAPPFSSLNSHWDFSSVFNSGFPKAQIRHLHNKSGEISTWQTTNPLFLCWPAHPQGIWGNKLIAVLLPFKKRELRSLWKDFTLLGWESRHILGRMSTDGRAMRPMSGGSKFWGGNGWFMYRVVEKHSCQVLRTSLKMFHCPLQNCIRAQ